MREPGAGDLVAEGVRDALDEPVLAQAAQVVGHFPRGDGLGGHAGELGQDGAQVAVGEAAGKKPEHAQGREQGVDAGITEAHARDAGAGPGGEGIADLADGGLAAGGVVAEFLDVQQTPGGREAGCPQRGQVIEPSADAGVAGVVDRGFRSERFALLVVLLDLRMLVVDVQGRHDTVGDDAGAEPAGYGPRPFADDPPGKDEPDLVRAADIQVVADDLLEEDPPGCSTLKWIWLTQPIRPVTGASSTWVRENSACSTETSYRCPDAVSSAVNGHGRIAIHLAARSQMTVSSKLSQICCTAATSSTAANPLSSGVNPIPARAAMALAYSDRPQQASYRHRRSIPGHMLSPQRSGRSPFRPAQLRACLDGLGRSPVSTTTES